jgi:hypothetical protein
MSSNSAYNSFRIKIKKLLAGLEMPIVTRRKSFKIMSLTPLFKMKLPRFITIPLMMLGQMIAVTTILKG